MLGSATFTTLTSSTTMNCAASISASTVHGRRGASWIVAVVVRSRVWSVVTVVRLGVTGDRGVVTARRPRGPTAGGGARWTSRSPSGGRAGGLGAGDVHERRRER